MSPDRFAVIGDPIAHSLSPAMQSAAFAASGLSASYEAIHVTSANLHAAVSHMRDGYRGFNVTVPHKESIIPLLDNVEPTVRRIGAINTVCIRNGVLSGFNTDVFGLLAALKRYEVDAAGARVVVLGAGGAARAVVFALDSAGAYVSIINRDTNKAERLAAGLGVVVEILSSGTPDGRASVAAASLVVNATSLGLRGLADPSPLPKESLIGPQAVAFDLIYGRPTAFQRQARENGCRVFDGLEMLVQQGAESFRLWTGLEPDLERMRYACVSQALEVK